MAESGDGNTTSTLLNGVSPYYRLNSYPFQNNFLPSLLHQQNVIMASTTERNKDANTIHMNGTMNHSTQQDAPTPPALATTVTHINTGDTDYGIDSPPPSGNDNDVVHPHTNNAANAAAVAKSALLILSQPGAGRAQHVYVCSIPGELRHGQPIHLITSSGHIFTTTVAQLTQDVGGRSPLSSTPPNSCLSLPTKSQKISDTKSVTSPLPSSSTLIQNNQSYPFPSSFCKSESLVCEDVQEQSVQKLLNATKDICMSQFARGKINATGNGLKRRSVDEESLDAGVSVDGINLEEIKEFAKSFKLKRLSLGLTQTQVGQALSMTEGPAYSQSAICRFEKLDITPKSAQKIKPVLEKWMGEVDEQVALGFLIPNVGPVVSQDYCIPSTALTHAAQSVHAFMPPATLSELNVNVNGTHTGSGPGAMSPASIALVGLSEANRKRKRRTSFTPQALDLLNQFFERNTHPTGAEMTALAESLGYDREVVRVWFCNKRQALKNTIKKLKHCHDAR